MASLYPPVVIAVTGAVLTPISHVGNEKTFLWFV